jgi:hypothetical protein
MIFWVIGPYFIYLLICISFKKAVIQTIMRKDPEEGVLA